MYALVMHIDATNADDESASDTMEIVGVYNTFDEAQEVIGRCRGEVALAGAKHGTKAFPYGTITFSIEKIAYDTPEQMVANWINPEWHEDN